MNEWTEVLYNAFLTLMVIGAAAWAISEIAAATQRFPRRDRQHLAPLMREEYRKGRGQ